MGGGGEKKAWDPVSWVLRFVRNHLRWWLAWAVVTVVVWQCRFERCGPNLLPLEVCRSLAHWQGAVKQDPEKVRADEQGLVLTKRKSGPNVSVQYHLQDVENVTHLAVTAWASWEGATPHPTVHWLMPRVVIIGWDHRNHFCAPLDHDVISARGTEDWHRVQTVIALPPNMKKVMLSVDAAGQMGTLRLKELKVEAVRPRPWIVPAAVIILFGWAWALWRLMRHWITGPWAASRRALVALGVLAGFWFFVFPQGRTMYPSLVGTFFLGKEIPAPARPAASSPASAQAPAAVAPVPAAPTTAVAPATTAARKSAAFSAWLRRMDRVMYWKKYNLTHITAYFGMSLVIFFLAASWRVWPLLVVMGLLSEIVPNALYNTWDIDDWWDLAADFTGIGAALLIVMILRRCFLGRAFAQEEEPKEVPEETAVADV